MKEEKNIEELNGNERLVVNEYENTDFVLGFGK